MGQSQCVCTSLPAVSIPLLSPRGGLLRNCIIRDGWHTRTLSEGARLLIQEADETPADGCFWVLLWAGANVLAQALWSVQNSRSTERLSKFVRKLRVYSISDQDDAGPW